jgi:hypothetical protein
MGVDRLVAGCDGLTLAAEPARDLFRATIRPSGGQRQLPADQAIGSAYADARVAPDLTIDCGPMPSENRRDLCDWHLGPKHVPDLAPLP